MDNKNKLIIRLGLLAGALAYFSLLSMAIYGVFIKPEAIGCGYGIRIAVGCTSFLGLTVTLVIIGVCAAYLLVSNWWGRGR